MLSLSETLQIQSMSGMSPSPVGPYPFCWIQEGTHNYLLPTSVLGLVTPPPSLPFFDNEIVIDIESSRPLDNLLALFCGSLVTYQVQLIPAKVSNLNMPWGQHQVRED